MTQATDVFRTMSEDEIRTFVKELRDNLKPLYKQLENVAAATLRLRPVYLGKQPFEKRCELIRKAMSLKVNADAAAEILPAYFMERHSKDVIELLDLLGVEHEEGMLKGDAPKAPTDAKLKTAVNKFRKGGENPVLRELLLKTFASQSAIDWPSLDAMLFPAGEAKAVS